MRNALAQLKSADPVIGRLIEEVGPFRPDYLAPNFETLARVIVYQQLSGKAALTIFNRLAAAAGSPLTPEAVLRLTPARMRKLGLSKQKTVYVRGLAVRTRAGQLDFPSLAGLPDETVIEALTAVKGVGVWSAHMFLMFALRRPDVLPVGDLGLRAAVRKTYGMADLPKPAELERFGERWSPYRTVATWYLWRSLESKPGL